MRCPLLGSVLVTAMVLAAVAPTAAHEPSKVDRSTLIRVLPGGRFHVEYQVWWGQFRGLDLRCETLDADGDRRLSDEEKDRFRKAEGEALARGLTLRADGRPVPLRVLASLLTCEGDQCVPKEVWITVTMVGEPLRPGIPETIEFHDDTPLEPLLAGSHDIRLEPPAGRRVATKEARLNGPEGILTGGCFRLVAAGPAAAAPVPEEGLLQSGAAAAGEGSGKTEDPFASLLEEFLSGEGGSLALLLALGISFWLGAGHALAPGHGKAMVAGYLVGSRGRVRDAILLGIVVTLTHISSVVALGLLMVFLSGWFKDENVLPWMTLSSGILIAVIGLSIFRRVWAKPSGGEEPHSHGFGIFRHSHGPRDATGHSHGHSHPHEHDHGQAHEHDHDHPHEHDHGHTHEHDHGQAHEHDHGHAHEHDHGHAHEHDHGHADGHAPPHGHGHSHDDDLARAHGTPAPPGGSRRGVSLRELLLLGISGGMVPCPSALVVLLTSVAFGATHIGLLLIAAFSVGLAMVLVGIGVFLVLAGRLGGRLGVSAGRWTRILPLVSGTVVTLVGLSIAVKGLDLLGVIRLRNWVGS